MSWDAHILSVGNSCRIGRSTRNFASFILSFMIKRKRRFRLRCSIAQGNLLHSQKKERQKEKKYKMKRNQQKGEGMIYFEYFFSIDVLCFITKLVRAKKKKKKSQHNNEIKHRHFLYPWDLSHRPILIIKGNDRNYIYRFPKDSVDLQLFFSLIFSYFFSFSCPFFVERISPSANDIITKVFPRLQTFILLHYLCL